MRLSGAFMPRISGYGPILGALIAAAFFTGPIIYAHSQVVTQPIPGPVNVCAYNTTPPTLTNAQAGMVQCDAAGALRVSSAPAVSGGLSVYFVQPAATDNAAVIKAGAGQVYKVTVTNNSATVNYLRLYNATTGFAGCNSATNLVYQVAIPASTSGAGIADTWPEGMAFATGISICVVSGYATNSTTAATASAMSVNIGYK